VTAVNADGSVVVGIGGIPAKIWPVRNLSFLFGKTVVRILTVNVEIGKWEDLLSITLGGKTFSGYSDDRRLGLIARLCVNGKKPDELPVWTQSFWMGSASNFSRLTIWRFWGSYFLCGPASFVPELRCSLPVNSLWRSGSFSQSTY
jgi:hypothetical protein